MSGAKEIRTKIKSIKNTQKITRAMEMVAASKMRKSQDRMAATRPYAQKIHDVISHVALSHSEYHHPYLQKRELKRVGVLIISTDRGLCGGLNINLFKEILKSITQWQKDGIEVDLCIIGRKAEAFFKRFDLNIIGITSQLGDKPSINELIGVVKIMLDNFDDNKLDAIYLGFNEFVNTMAQKPNIKQLLPLQPAENGPRAQYWDYIYEPDAKELLDILLSRYIESEVYQGVVENIACEQAARMVAMKSASDNADDLITEFQLAYNKARQAAITQEIAEIIGGAAAV